MLNASLGKPSLEGLSISTAKVCCLIQVNPL
jgi:hypothetical protein